MRVVSLQSFNVSDADAPGKERVFAVTLIDAAPIWVPADIDHRRSIDQALMRALESRVLMPTIVNRARFVGDGRGFAVNQVRVPGRSHGDGNGKHRARLSPANPVQALIPFVGTQAKPFQVRAVVVE